MMLKLKLILITCAVLNGCAKGGLVDISNPYIADPDYFFPSGVLKLKKIEISVKPQTYKVSVLTTGPLIPIFPRGSGDDFDRQRHNLKVILQFDTSTTGISFYPGQTLLKMNNIKYLPSRHSGILSTITYPPEAAKSIPGHKWTCKGIDSEVNRTDFNKSLLLEQKTCIVLEYPIITPETNAKFSISIQGLSENQIPIIVPIIHFKPGRTGIYSIKG